jgi:hypothetical protein
MPHYARIQDAKVREVREFDSVKGRFHPSLTWVKCPQEVEEGWQYDANTDEFVEPPDTSPTLSEAKEQKVDQIKKRANSALSETDWYVVRKQETGEPIPQDVVDHRSKVRSLSDQFESEVTDLSGVDNVLSYSFIYPEPPEL